MAVALSAISSAKLIQLIILLVYILVMVAIAYFCRKKTSNVDDYLLAGRGLNGWMSAFSYGTAYFSAVIFVGYAGKFGWNFGLSATFIGLGNAIFGTYLAWKVLGRRTRNITRSLNARTLPEFFEKRYESKNIKMASCIIIFVFLIPYSTSVYQGLAYLFEAMFGISFIWCIVLMASVTALYLFFGGYLATSMSDFVQGIIMLAGVIVMVLMLFARPEVNWGEGIAKLVKNYGWFPTFKGGMLIDSPGFNLVILILLTSFGIWALPQSIHKFYAIRDDEAIKKATVISTGFSGIIGIGAYLTGALTSLFLVRSDFGSYDTAVPIMLTKALPSAMLGLILVLVLSASMSTLSSLSLAGSSAIAVDLYKGYINPNADDKKVKIILRIMCLCFVILSAVLAILNIDIIVTLMSLSWGTLAGCFMGPYVLGLYSKKITKAGAWSSLICGLLVTLALTIIFGYLDAPKGVHFGIILKTGIGRSPLTGVVAMVVSVIVTPLVSLFTKKPSENVLKQIK